MMKRNQQREREIETNSEKDINNVLNYITPHHFSGHSVEKIGRSWLTFSEELLYYFTLFVINAILIALSVCLVWFVL